MPITTKDTFTAARRKFSELEKHAVLACLHIKKFTARLDVIMLEPESFERRQSIAQAVNELDMAKDMLWHAGLCRTLPVRYKGRGTKAK